MEISDLPGINQQINLKEVSSIHEKRTLAFLNHFILTTVGFINDFSVNTERKLVNISERLRRLDACMQILESKLDSLPESRNNSTKNDVVTEEPIVEEDKTTNCSEIDKPQPASTNSQNAIDKIKVKDDPRYLKFFRMLSVGVPPPAIKIKMASENLNKDLLDTPNAMIAMEGFDVNDEEGDNVEFEDEIIFSSSDENDDSDEFSN